MRIETNNVNIIPSGTNGGSQNFQEFVRPQNAYYHYTDTSEYAHVMLKGSASNQYGIFTFAKPNIHPMARIKV